MSKGINFVNKMVSIWHTSGSLYLRVARQCLETNGRIQGKNKTGEKENEGLLPYTVFSIELLTIPRTNWKWQRVVLGVTLKLYDKTVGIVRNSHCQWESPTPIGILAVLGSDQLATLICMPRPCAARAAGHPQDRTQMDWLATVPGPQEKRQTTEK